MSDRPPERSTGQDETPDLGALLLVVIRLLEDIEPELRDDDDLLVRIAVTRRVLIRTRKRML